MLVFLLGVRGAGKTTLSEKLKATKWATVIQPSTTRAPRSKTDTEYDFVSVWSDPLYAWKIEVGGQTYGVRLSEIEKARDDICFCVFDPMHFDTLDAFRRKKTIQILTIGLDTVQSLEMQLARVAGDTKRVMNAKDFEQARKVVRSCDLVVSNGPDEILSAVSEALKLLRSCGGILVKETIETFVNAGALLTGADNEEIRPASYDLRVGDQAWCQGKLITLTSEAPTLQIPPYSYAIVSAREQARLPSFVTGRFDLKVSLFFDGIILSNGPQVDPGYNGALFCMLFNGSDRSRGLTRENHFATIEFCTTTQTTEGYHQAYQFRDRLERFMHDNALAGPGGTILETTNAKLNLLGERMARLEGSFWGRFAGQMALLAAILIPFGFLYNSLWDRVKEAENIVQQMHDESKGTSTVLQNDRSEALLAIAKAREKAIEAIKRVK